MKYYKTTLFIILTTMLLTTSAQAQTYMYLMDKSQYQESFSPYNPYPEYGFQKGGNGLIQLPSSIQFDGSVLHFNTQGYSPTIPDDFPLIPASGNTATAEWTNSHGGHSKITVHLDQPKTITVNYSIEYDQKINGITTHVKGLANATYHPL